MRDPFRPKYAEKYEKTCGGKKQNKKHSYRARHVHMKHVQNFRVYISKMAWALVSEGIWGLMLLNQPENGSCCRYVTPINAVQPEPMSFNTCMYTDCCT